MLLNFITKYSKYPKTLIKQGFYQLVKYSKNRQTNWQALADKHCHLSQFCIMNFKCYAMKIITIEEEAWQQLNSRINAIVDYLKKQEDKSYDDLWLNNHEVCQYLHISEKTLWRMRTKGEIDYSKIYGQYFYTIGAIKNMLNANAIQSSDEFVQELMAKGKSYIEKGRKLKTDKK